MFYDAKYRVGRGKPLEDRERARLDMPLHTQKESWRLWAALLVSPKIKSVPHCAWISKTIILLLPGGCS
jgi:hypothetical protein